MEVLGLRDFYNTIISKYFVVKIIDLRSRESFLQCHVSGALNIDIQNIVKNIRNENFKITEETIWNELSKVGCIVNTLSKVTAQFCFIGDKQTNDLSEIIELSFSEIIKTKRGFMCCQTFEEFKEHYPFMCVFEEDSTSSNTERIPFRSSIMPNEIFDNLFLGQCPMGNTLFFIKELKITHILNCALECNYETPPNVVMKKIRINDETTETIPFDEVISFIDNALNEKESGKHVRVFVHCQMGISRSASVVAAWLMSHFGIDVDTALSVVKKQRIIVRPNDGFLRQLILYDRKLEKERKHQKETSLKEEDFVQRVDCSADADVTEVILKHEGKDDEQSPASSSAQPSNIESEGKSEVTKFTSLELPKFSAPLFDALKRIKAEIDREEKQKALVKASDELEQKS